MIRHIVWFEFKESALGNTAEENAAKLRMMLERLGTLDTVQHMEFSRAILHTSTEDVSFIFQTWHESYEQFREYVAHQDQVDARDFIRKVAVSRKCIDYEV
jgi:hypothetical protein